MKYNADGHNSQIIIGCGLGTKELYGTVVEDSFKMVLVSNKLTLYEIDIRKLRAEIDGRSSIQFEGSNEQGQALYNLSNTEKTDNALGDSIGSDGKYSLLNKVEDQPIIHDYLAVLQIDPSECRSYFDAPRNMYVAICRDMMVIADLNKSRLESGLHDARDIVQVAYFQRHLTSSEN